MTLLRPDTGPPADLPLVLEHGPFAQALRTVLRAHGLTLDAARRGLQRRGIEVSLASLSHWQSGQHLPRPDTWLRLGPALDDLLKLPVGTMGSLLEKARVPVDSHQALQDNADPAYTLVRDDIGAGEDTFWSPLSVRQNAEVSAAGWLLSIHGSSLRRVTTAGSRVCLIYVALDRRAPLSWRSDTHAVGKVATDERHGSSAAELLLDAPLQRDDVVRVDSSVLWADGPTEFSASEPQQQVGHCVGENCRDWSLSVQFASGRRPARTWLSWSPSPFGQHDQMVLRDLPISGHGVVQASVLDPRPGTHSIHWTF